MRDEGKDWCEMCGRFRVLEGGRCAECWSFNPTARAAYDYLQAWRNLFAAIIGAFHNDAARVRRLVRKLLRRPTDTGESDGA